jgi:thiol-disulfide isomerase/thioredoxin
MMKRVSGAGKSVAAAGKGKSGKRLLTALLLVGAVALGAYVLAVAFGVGGLGRREGFAEAQGPRWTLVLMHSTSCPHCKTFLPVFESVKSELQRRAAGALTIHTYEAGEVGARQYLDMVQGFPTLLLFKNDAPAGSLVGSQSAERVLAFAESAGVFGGATAGA